MAQCVCCGKLSEKFICPYHWNMLPMSIRKSRGMDDTKWARIVRFFKDQGELGNWYDDGPYRAANPQEDNSSEG